ncbi:MAG: TolC family protein [Arcticibacter sp.]
MRTIFTILLLYGFSIEPLSSQDLKKILAEIVVNNKELASSLQYCESQKIISKSGITPDNPSVEFDYMFGNPKEIGNQTDLTISQSFDFPTVYRYKQRLSRNNLGKAELEYLLKRQDVLWHAKRVCIEIVYRRKIQKELSVRLKNMQSLQLVFQTRLEKGDGNLIDLNKVKLQQLKVKDLYQKNEIEIDHLTFNLTQLNGGVSFSYNDSLFPAVIELPQLEMILSDVLENDVELRMLHQDYEIGKNSVLLSRAQSYPKFVGGYHSQEIADQRFSGLHVGFTVPLWENKNAVKGKKAEVVYVESKIASRKVEIQSNVNELFNRAKVLRISADEFKTALDSINNITLLEKSLALGHITVGEYFLETDYFYDAYATYLELEMEYNKTLADLFKYQL